MVVQSISSRFAPLRRDAVPVLVCALFVVLLACSSGAMTTDPQIDSLPRVGFERPGFPAAPQMPLSRHGEALLLVLSLEILSAGLMVHYRARDRRAHDQTSARYFVPLAFAAAGTLVALPAAVDGRWGAVTLVWIGSNVTLALFAGFFLTFPKDRWSRLRRAILLAIVPLLVLSAIAVLIAPATGPLVGVVGIAYKTACILITVGAVSRAFGGKASPAERRLRPLLLGAGCTALLTLGSLIYPLGNEQLDRIAAETALVSWLALSVGFAWATLRHGILGVNVGQLTLLRSVFDSVADPIFVVDREGRIVSCSRAGRLLTGCNDGTPAELFATLIGRIEIGGASRMPAEAIVRRVFAGESVRDSEQILRAADGTVVCMSLTATPILDSGEVVLGVFVYRDFTERMESERLREEHLTLLAHDLRAPMTILQTQAQMLLRRPEVAGLPTIEQSARRIDASAHQLNRLLTDLIEVTRLEAGLIRPRFEPFAVTSLLDDMAIRWSDGSPAGRLKVSAPPDLWVDVDAILLDRAITNVVANAFNYTPADTPIELSAMRAGAQIEIVVRDHGPGIAAEDLPLIFERRYRGQTSRGIDGTGLGLYICRMIAELHRGRISVESEPGVGSTFRLTFPESRARGGESLASETVYRGEESPAESPVG